MEPDQQPSNDPSRIEGETFFTLIGRKKEVDSDTSETSSYHSDDDNKVNNAAG